MQVEPDHSRCPAGAHVGVASLWQVTLIRCLTLVLVGLCLGADCASSAPDRCGVPSWAPGVAVEYESWTIRTSDAWLGRVPSPAQSLHRDLQLLHVREQFVCTQALDGGTPGAGIGWFKEWAVHDGVLDASLQGALVSYDGGLGTWEIADGRIPSAFARAWLTSRAKALDPFNNALCRLSGSPSGPEGGPEATGVEHAASILGFKTYAHGKSIVRRTKQVGSDERLKVGIRGMLADVGLAKFDGATWEVGGDYPYVAEWETGSEPLGCVGSGQLFGELQGVLSTESGAISIASQVYHSIGVRRVDKEERQFAQEWARHKAAQTPSGILPLISDLRDGGRRTRLFGVEVGESRVRIPAWAGEAGRRLAVIRAGGEFEWMVEVNSVAGAGLMDWARAPGSPPKFAQPIPEGASTHADGGRELFFGFRPGEDGTAERRAWMVESRRSTGGADLHPVLGFAPDESLGGPWLIEDELGSLLGWTGGASITGPVTLCRLFQGDLGTASKTIGSVACHGESTGPLAIALVDPGVLWDDDVEGSAHGPEGAAASEHASGAFAAASVQLAHGDLAAATRTMRMLGEAQPVYAAFLRSIGMVLMDAMPLAARANGDRHLLARWQLMAATCLLPDVRGAIGLAATLFRIDEVDRALNLYAGLRRSTGSSRDASVGSAACMLRKGRPVEAMEVLVAIEKLEQDVDALVLYVDCLLTLRRTSEALEVLRRFRAAVRPGVVLERDVLALMQSGDKPGALEAAIRLQAEPATRVIGFRYLAWVRNEMGQPREALRILEDGTKEAPRDVALRRVAIQYYVAAGEREGAARHLAALGRLDAEAAREMSSIVDRMPEDGGR